jgi:ATP-binding cassette subfamily B protein
MMFSAGLCVLLVLGYGGNLVLNKEMTMGDLTSFVVYSGMIASSLGTVSGVYFELLKSLGATERVYGIITRIPSIPISTDEYESYGGKKRLINSISNLEGEIRFDNVTFTYPMRVDRVVLHSLNLELHPGRVVALVGESGGGKSTCTQLIQRFYDPDSGSITLDGIDLRDIDPKYLREQIGVVSQEPYLFATTIRDNIKYSRDNATEEDVISAARQANAHDFITQFPQGYNTLVGERGTQLSGGQKQRVAIAQAILKKPKILLLDEATSALDSESEHLVQQALERLMQGKTVLVIAHRLSTVRNADVVCVMKQGVIIERGTHVELIERGGYYKQLVDRQLLGEKRSQEALRGEKK